MNDRDFIQMQNATDIKAIFDAINGLKSRRETICKTDVADIAGAALALYLLVGIEKKEAA